MHFCGVEVLPLTPFLVEIIAPLLKYIHKRSDGCSYGGGIPSVIDVSGLSVHVFFNVVEITKILFIFCIHFTISDGCIMSRVECRSCVINRRNGFTSKLFVDEGGVSEMSMDGF